jgi:O-antigen ligase
MQGLTGTLSLGREKRALSRSQARLGLLGFAAAHAGLGLALHTWPALATAHAGVALLVGIWAALRWPLPRVACVGAYIVGGEVLWRMTGAQIPWEFGKYALSLVFVIAVLRLGRHASWQAAPLVYFAVLLPSVLLLMADSALSHVQIVRMVSFNLSGPLSLAVSAWVLSQLELRQEETERILISLIGPITGIAAITLLTTYTTEGLTFTEESNMLSSGGFGPNQVANMLSLGALAALLLAMFANTRQPRMVAAALMLLFVVQSAMTFSRGGVYGFLLGVAVFVCLVGSVRALGRLLTVGAVSLFLVSVIVLPRLNAFTDGALTARFTDTEPAQRKEIVREDLRLWREHPLVGLGPGVGMKHRRVESRIAHTEYSRLLAEHGMMGIIAILALCSMVIRQWRRPQKPMDRALGMTLIAWSLFSMAHSGMRIAAFGFAFGLGQARRLLDARASE